MAFLCAMIFCPWAVVARAQTPASPDQILSLMQKAFDWQISQLPTEQTGSHDGPDGWIRAAFYTGGMALYRANHNEADLTALQKIAQKNRWQPATRPSNNHHADDLAVGQLYTELYLIKKDPAMIAPLKERFAAIMAKPLAGRADWWWCDSLFMAPPTLARLSAATGDSTYVDFMNKQWWDTTDFLFDKSESLYFRDKSYFKKTEKNGQKVFWSRGNGWVMAGTARVLEYLPANYPDRPKYISLMKEMAGKIARLQQPDGFWRVSLLDPDAYPGGETSGTGFYCFALAWGINNGVLDKQTYLPVVNKAWAALVSAVDPPTGKVGWVQPVGAAPASVKADDIAEYGTGAFLLAGSEVLKLQQSSP